MLSLCTKFNLEYSHFPQKNLGSIAVSVQKYLMLPACTQPIIAALGTVPLLLAGAKLTLSTQADIKIIK